MTREISFVIPGAPVPKASVRVGFRGGVIPKRTRDYMRHVASWSKVEMMKAKMAPFRGSVEIDVTFYEPDRRRRDIDNLEKSLLDGLTKGGVWEDDSQVRSVSKRRAVDRRDPRVEVVVRGE